MASIWEEVTKAAITSGVQEATVQGLPKDSSLLAKISSKMVAGAVSHVAWEAIKAFGNFLQVVHVTDPKTGQKLEFENYQKFQAWFSQLSIEDQTKCLELQEEDRRRYEKDFGYLRARAGY